MAKNKIYKAIVSVTSTSRYMYYVEAKNQNELQKKLSSGETIDEIIMAYDGVIDRQVHSETIEKV